MIVLKIKGEETFFGERIDIPEEFIEDLCERVNTEIFRNLCFVV